MAATSKDDDTAAKAYEAAAEKKTTTAPKAAKPAPVKTAKAKAPKAPAKKPVAPKTAAAKTVVKAPAPKAVTAKPKTKAPAKKPVKKPVAAKKPAATVKTTTQEIFVMTTPEEMTKSFQDAFADIQTRGKAAYEKGTELFADAGEFAKGNLEALVETGKILTTGIQEMGRSAVAEGKAEFEEITAEVKELAAVKSPTDFFQLQSTLLRKHFDKAIAAGSKNTEAMLKLANDAAQPISSRVSLAMEKVKAA